MITFNSLAKIVTASIRQLMMLMLIFRALPSQVPSSIDLIGSCMCLCVSGVPRFIYCSNPAISQPTALHEAGTFAGATWARIALRVFFPACAALNPRNERAAVLDIYFGQPTYKMVTS